MVLSCRLEQVRRNFPFAFRPLCLHLDNHKPDSWLLLSISIFHEALLGSRPQGCAPLKANVQGATTVEQVVQIILNG